MLGTCSVPYRSCTGKGFPGIPDLFRKSIPMKRSYILLSLCGMVGNSLQAQHSPASASSPNVVFIYADDMGRGMLSHFGQQIIKTPHIDRIFNEGIGFEYAYGCMYSAPSRASLLTGYHDCRRGKWRISRGGQLQEADTPEKWERVEEAVNRQHIELPTGDYYLPQIFKKAGYVTGQFGKLEWGFTATKEQMKTHGWDEYCGYLDHQRAHFYYPGFLFENDTIVYFPENNHPTSGRGFESETPENYRARWDMCGKVTYSQDIFLNRILTFIRKHQEERFFLYHPTQLPHGPVAIPAVHPSVKHRTDLSEIEKEYASMVLKLDEHVGIILDELERLGLLENTIIIFSSDNGHETYYTNGVRCRKSPNRSMDNQKFDAWDYPYTSERTGDRFDGNDGMSGKKWMNWEGSVRVPLTMMWKGHISEGQMLDQVVSHYDLLPTFAEFLKVKLTTKKDGESLLPVLFGGKQSLEHERYVFLNAPEGPAVVSSDHWKLRYHRKRKQYRLHYLPEDYQEQKILNDENPEMLEKLKKILEPYLHE